MFHIILLTVLFIVIFGILLVIKFSKSRGVSGEKKVFFEKNLRKISVDVDKKHKIIDLDKLYHKLLLEIWHEGTFGDILKSEPREIDNLNKIWELHKLRNKLVHDFDLLDERILTRKSIEYQKEFEKLLKKVS